MVPHQQHVPSCCTCQVNSSTSTVCLLGDVNTPLPDAAPAAGQAVDSAKALGPSTACTTACPGKATQQCGGSLALNLYALQKAPWLEADSTSTGPSLLTGTACVGAAAASPACQGTVGSAAAGVVLSRVVVGLAAVMAIAAL